MTKFCTNCGAQTTEGASFCNKCGTKLAPMPPAPEAPAPEPAPKAFAYAPPPDPYRPPPDFGQTPLAPPAAGGLQANVAGALSYLLGVITGVLFLALDPYNKDRFVRFHAFQAIFLFVAWIVLSVAASVLSSVLPWFLDSLFWAAVNLGGLAVWLFVMYKAYSHEMYKLPVIGEIAERQAG